MKSVDITQRVIENLERYAPKQAVLLLAVSGGADSVTLLRILKASIYKDTIAVAHFDHALRETSNDDAAFVKALCQTLNVAFYRERVEVAKIAKEKKWNLEDAARRLRYSFLTRIAKQIKASFILTAHTQDDQVETVLMQLLRGAAHLTGMHEVQGNIIRPLLNVSKHELLEYLNNINQDYKTDESNFDITRTRAWLRHEIVPRLEQRYPHLKKILAQLAQLQQDHQAYLTQQSQRLFIGNQLEIERLHRAHPSLQRQAIAALLERANAPVTRDALERILGLLDQTETVQVSLSSHQSVALSAGTLRVIKKGESPKLVRSDHQTSDHQTDETFMKQALKLAVKAAKQGELPVGCVIVKNHGIIAEAHNETETNKDPFAHAEVLAMQRAAAYLGDWRLEHCTLYVTFEPCPMCFGAMLQAHLSRVVYGAKNTRDGALGTVMDMQDAPWKRHVEIKAGVLGKACSKHLKLFFDTKR
jgi:tRNA(Ile)-lysidine synthase